MKLLVVDDNERVRRTIKCVVEDMTDEFFECGDGDEALRLYRLHLPDWVTMDIRMKHADGLDVTRKIKTFFPQARIIIVSEYDDVELRRNALLAGARDYVVKRELFDLRTILRRRH